MNNTALKMDDEKEPTLSIVKPSSETTWIKNMLGKMGSFFDRPIHASEDFETWRRLEFRNEFRHERDQRNPYWRL